VDEVLPFLEESCRNYGYPVLIAGVLLENAGVPVPGETAVLVAGFLASKGIFSIYLVIPFTALAAIVGDNIGFWLGHRFARPQVKAGKRFLFLTPEGVRRAENYFERYGSWTIFFARFITGLRVIGALAAGTAGMHWLRFFVANAAGACTWATTIGLLGYFFGQFLPFVEQVLSRTGMVLLLIVLLALGVAWIRHRRGRRSSPPPTMKSE
jgi:membrane-associated protein